MHYEQQTKSQRLYKILLQYTAVYDRRAIMRSMRLRCIADCKDGGRSIRLTMRKHRGPKKEPFYHSWFVCCFLLTVVLGRTITGTLALDTSGSSDWKPTKSDHSSATLFQPCKDIEVIGPSQFPKPTDKLDSHATVVVEPLFGHHRPEQDAILAYAEGYKLPYYMMFMESLNKTGYSGDVVLAIAEKRIVKHDVIPYLRTFADKSTGLNLVVYQMDLECANDDPSDTKRLVMPRSGLTDVFQMCQLNHVYGWKDERGQVMSTAHDPREGRVVATLRYEWYWMWSLQYDPHSWLMLLDSRDSYFQSDPFVNLPRDTNNSPDGRLYFFGENTNATSLGVSRKNAKWITNGYGAKVFEHIKDKPTICSGGTMGEQIAIDTYLRALINEHDENNIKMTGSDQGFHNYLWYSSKLLGAASIREVTVWEQGHGIINNVGAMRIKPLSEWGIYNSKTNDTDVYQWDGVTLSPVVHQWDRDKELDRAVISWHNVLEKKWSDQRGANGSTK